MTTDTVSNEYNTEDDTLSCAISQANASMSECEIVYLDFDGEETRYINSDLDLDFAVTVEDSGLSDSQIQYIIDTLNDNTEGVIYVSEKPADSDFSTVYIGESDDFASYGDFLGLAETIDIGNLINDDKAFVFADASWSLDYIAEVIDHEVGHLMGEQHESITGTLEDYAATLFRWDLMTGLISRSDGIHTISSRIEHFIYYDYYSASKRSGYSNSDRYTIILQPGESVEITFTATQALDLFVFTNGSASSSSAYLSSIRSFSSSTGSTFTIDYNASYPTVYLYVGIQSVNYANQQVNYTIQSVLITDGQNPTDLDPTVTAGPDLTVSQVEFYSSWSKITACYQENSFIVQFTICNDGNQRSAATVASIYNGSTKIGEVAISALAKYSSACYEFSVPAGTLAEGSQTIRVVVDSSNNIAETNESNNSDSEVIIIEKKRPDLYFTSDLSYKVGSTTVESCQNIDEVKLSFTYRNQGFGTANNSYATIYVDGVSIGVIELGDVTYNTTVSKTFTINPGELDVGDHKISVVISCDDETLTSNNTITSTLTVEKGSNIEFDKFEFDNTFETAQLLTDENHSIYKGDEDWMYFEILESNNYSISVEGWNSSYIILYDANGKWMDSAHTTTATIVEYLDPGYYYISVSGWGSAETSSYSVDVSKSLSYVYFYYNSSWSDGVSLSQDIETHDTNTVFSSQSSIYLDFNVKNRGDGDAKSFDVGIYLNGSLYCTVSTDGYLASGEIFTWNDINLGCLEAGDYKLELVSDINGDIDNAENSSITVTREFTVTDDKPSVDIKFVNYFANQTEDVILSTTQGVYSSASVITNVDNVYISFYSEEANNLSTAPFRIDIYIDGEIYRTLIADGIDVGYVLGAKDYSLGKLSSGSHTISVVLDSLDDVGETNESNNVYSTCFEVLDVVPSVALSSMDAVDYGRSITMSWDSVDVAASYILEYGLESDFSSPFQVSLTETSYTTQILGSGDYYWRVRTVHSTGVYSEWTTNDESVYIDANAVGITIDSPEIKQTGDGKISVTFNWSSSAANVSYQLIVDGKTYNMGSTTSKTLQLNDGEHSYELIATDQYGTSTSSSEQSFYFDASSPSISLDTPFTRCDDGGNVSTLFSWTCDEYASFVFSINGKSYSTSQSSIDLALEEGKYSYSLTATDSSGNSTTLSKSLTISSTSYIINETVAKNESVTLGGMYYLQKFTVAAGTKVNGLQQYTEVVVTGSITGTDKADTYSFGNYSEVNIESSMSLDSGNDTLKVSSYSVFNAQDIDFGDGTNKLTVGAQSTASMGKLTDMSQLTLSAGKLGLVTGFSSGSIMGTYAANTYSFGNYSEVDINGTISLYDGNDTIKIGSYSTFEATSIAFGTGSNSLTVGAQSEVELGALTDLGKLTLSAGKVYLETTLTTGSITGTSAANTYSFGNYSEVDINGTISLYDGNDTIKIGSYSTFEATSIAFGTGSNSLTIGAQSEVELGALTDLGKLTLSAGKLSLETTLTTGSITGTSAANTYSFGNYSEVDINGTISLGDGNDSIKIGTYSLFVSGDIDFGTSVDNKSVSNSFTLGALSSANVGDITQLCKLTISAGKVINGVVTWTSFIAGDITGTVKADTYSFAQYNQAEVDSISMGDGNDSLKIGNYAQIYIGELNMGAGTDSITIGSNSIVFIDATSVEKISVGSNNTLYLSNELIAMLDEKVKVNNTVLSLDDYAYMSIENSASELSSYALSEPVSDLELDSSSYAMMENSAEGEDIFDAYQVQLSEVGNVDISLCCEVDSQLQSLSTDEQDASPSLVSNSSLDGELDLSSGYYYLQSSSLDTSSDSCAYSLSVDACLEEENNALLAS